MSADCHLTIKKCEKETYNIYSTEFHTFIFNALLKPLAKKPPKGAIIDANNPKHKACHCTGRMAISFT